MFSLLIYVDLGNHFNHEWDIAEEIWYKTFCNYLYIYMWCINLHFNIETHLTKKFIWGWFNRNRKNNRKEHICFCLYGLDLDTMKSSARGLIDKQQIISEEKSKYLVFDLIKGGYYLKEKYEQIFRILLQLNKA